MVDFCEPNAKIEMVRSWKTVKSFRRFGPKRNYFLNRFAFIFRTHFTSKRAAVLSV